MRTILTALFVFLSGFGSAAHAQNKFLPPIPRPTLTALQAIEIAQKTIDARQPVIVDVGWALIDVRWVRGSDFQVPVDDGAQYIVPTDRDKYSWFVTYLYRVPSIANLWQGMGWVGQFTSQLVFRVNDDGTLGPMGAVRTRNDVEVGRPSVLAKNE